MNNMNLSEKICEYQEIREKVELRLTRKFEDKKLMEQMPCVDFGEMGMLLVFYVRLGVINGVEIGFYINNNHLELWDMSAMELFEDMVRL